MDTVVRFISSFFISSLFPLLFFFIYNFWGRERERAVRTMETVVRFILWRNIDGMKMIYVPLTLFFSNIWYVTCL